MSPSLIIIICTLYIGMLFGVAYFANRQSEKGRSIVSNPYIYALSLAIYCTAWTFYGSVGRASTQGLAFLPSYLGPAIFAPLWIIVLKKIIIISKAQRITSVADFISSRYGKSTALGIMATLIAVFGIIPYISIQLKAIAVSYDILTGHTENLNRVLPLFSDTALYIAIALAIFAILFGTRNLDPNERHEGLVAAIALESLIKLFAFLAVGIFVTFGLYNGFGDLFDKAYELEQIVQLFDFENTNINSWEWFWLCFLSMSAILLLPRQFHISVVENTNPNYVSKAAWLFPLYMLLINIFVIPIAVGGLLNLPGDTYSPDTFVLSLPLHFGNEWLALLAGIGGFSAATSMVIVAVLALSIMISNNLVMPSLIKSNLLNETHVSNLTQRLLGIRRLSIVSVLLLAYLYFRFVGKAYSLVSIGLISFTAIAQFLPVVMGAIYWKRGTKKGAIAGLSVGFLVWALTLPVPTLAEAGILPGTILQSGYFGISWLHPYHLFGMEGMSSISHSAFWSLLLNTLVFIIVSINTSAAPLEITQADLFVDIYKYQFGSTDFEVMHRRARVKDLKELLDRFLGNNRAVTVLHAFEQAHQVDLSKETTAKAELVNYAETHLAGAIGAASAKVIIGSVSKSDPISLEEMFKILEQTKEIMQYSKALERKSAELERTTFQLRLANEQLKELDLLKAEFITTITHELRTPITSIKALSKILLDNEDLSESQKSEFLQILVSESERITRLINQVLDLEKLQSVPKEKQKLLPVNMRMIVYRAFSGVKAMIDSEGIDYKLDLPDQAIMVKGNPDHLTQVVVNLLSNAIKFCDPENGKIQIQLSTIDSGMRFSIWNNGKGIAPKDLQRIFEKFTQVQDQQLGKPKGSGLGLAICKSILEQHNGTISVESELETGTTFYVEIPTLE